MKKNRRQFGWLMCLGVACFVAQMSFAIQYSNDIASIVQRGELRVAICADDAGAPFILMNGNQISGGYDVGLSQALARELGVKLKIDQAVSYDQAVAFVASGRDDIAVSNLTPTPDRARSVYFSHPYYEFPLVLVAKNSFDISTFNLSQEIVSRDASLNIAAQANSADLYYAKLAFPQAQIIPFTDLSQAVEAVKNNQYDAILTDKFAAQQAVLGEPFISVFNLGKRHVDPQTIAVNSNMPQLLSWLDTYLSSVQGTVEQESLKNTARLP